MMRNKLTFAKRLFVAIVVLQFFGCNRTQSEEEVQPPQASLEQAMPECVEAKAGGPEEMLRKLYHQDAKSVSRIDTHDDGTLVVRLSKFFDKDLAKYMMDGRLDCHLGAEADACDVSAFISAGNEKQVKDFHVCAMDSRNTVRVRFMDKDKPTEFTYTLAQTPDGWRISAISHIGITYDGEL